MDKQHSPREKSSTKKFSSIDKGKIVEHIVALMHRYPDTSVKVEQNVHLSPIQNKTGRKREIDVLLTKEIAGHAIQIGVTISMMLLANLLQHLLG